MRNFVLLAAFLHSASAREITIPIPPRGGPGVNLMDGSITLTWTVGWKALPAEPGDPPNRVRGEYIVHPTLPQVKDTNDTGDWKEVNIMVPVDPAHPIKDYHTSIFDPLKGNINKTDTIAALQMPGVGWVMQDLEPFVHDFQAPILGGTAQNGPAIYTALNLAQFSNPAGLVLDLGTVGISVVDGRIVGLAGLYFATSPFVFSASSETGFVPSGGLGDWLNTSTFGDVYVVATQSSSSVPEPATWMLAAPGLALVAFARFRREVHMHFFARAATARFAPASTARNRRHSGVSA